MKKIVKVSGLFLCMMLLVCSALTVAEATRVDFKIGDEGSIKGSALTIISDYTIYSGESFSLDEGGSWTFDYAKIFVNSKKTKINSWDITASIDFDLPYDVGLVDSKGIVTKTKTKTSKKGKKVFKKRCRGGCGITRTRVDIDLDFDLTTVYFGSGNTGIFTVGINDLSWKNKCCKMSPKTLTATVTLVSAPAPVPEPATMLLFGIGLAGLVGSRIKRNKK